MPSHHAPVPGTESNLTSCQWSPLVTGSNRLPTANNCQHNEDVILVCGLPDESYPSPTPAPTPSPTPIPTPSPSSYCPWGRSMYLNGVYYTMGQCTATGTSAASSCGAAGAPSGTTLASVDSHDGLVAVSSLCGVFGGPGCWVGSGSGALACYT